MSDLRVESYGEKEVSAKKRSISRRVAAVGGAAVLTLGLFGLVGCVDEDEQPPPPGGAGAWFISDLEEIEDEDIEGSEKG